MSYRDLARDIISIENPNYGRYVDDISFPSRVKEASIGKRENNEKIKRFLLELKEMLHSNKGTKRVKSMHNDKNK